MLCIQSLSCQTIFITSHKVQNNYYKYIEKQHSVVYRTPLVTVWLIWILKNCMPPFIYYCSVMWLFVPTCIRAAMMLIQIMYLFVNSSWNWPNSKPCRNIREGCACHERDKTCFFNTVVPLAGYWLYTRALTIHHLWGLGPYTRTNVVLFHHSHMEAQFGMNTVNVTCIKKKVNKNHLSNVSSQQSGTYAHGFACISYTYI